MCRATEKVDALKPSLSSNMRHDMWHVIKKKLNGIDLNTNLSQGQKMLGTFK